jgi:hypothetical protein
MIQASKTSYIHQEWNETLSRQEFKCYFREGELTDVIFYSATEEQEVHGVTHFHPKSTIYLCWDQNQNRISELTGRQLGQCKNLKNKILTFAKEIFKGLQDNLNDDFWCLNQLVRIDVFMESETACKLVEIQPWYGMGMFYDNQDCALESLVDLYNQIYKNLCVL